MCIYVQMNAHLRDVCFLSGFSPHERNCTTFSHFVHFEARIMSVFFREIRVNTREKNGNTRPSRSSKCTFSSSSEHKKVRKSVNPSENCYEQKKVLSEDPGIHSIDPIVIHSYSLL